MTDISDVANAFIDNCDEFRIPENRRMPMVLSELARVTKERDQLARALSVRTKERDAAVSSANRLQAIVTSEALERYPQR